MGSRGKPLTSMGRIIIVLLNIKGSSYRSEKRPTRIPSIRSQDPGPGQIPANKTFIQAITPGIKVFFITPGDKEAKVILASSSEV
jgi:hypothetical protein